MPKPKLNEVATFAEFERKYPGYFENRVANLPPIDPAVVPENLRRLIPYAERWGIPHTLIRIRFCEAASPEIVADFKHALSGTHGFYEDWSYLEQLPYWNDQESADRAASQDDDEPSPELRYARRRFGMMYLAEMESFQGRGVRGFLTWYKEHDPEGYKRWDDSRNG